jgi:hypothetical protein
MTNQYPAPWSLKGKGYIFLYRFPRSFEKNPAFISSVTSEPFGGFGTVMLVDYSESNAGPYRELLFIPGEFSFLKKKYYSITKIYVSTMESVDNGRKNWGIPKEHADFEIITIDKKTERIIVKKDGTVFFDVTLKKRCIPFRVNTKYISHAIAQKLHSETVFITEFQGSGTAKFAALKSISCDEKFFPKICAVKPLVVTAIDNFTIEFPEADKLILQKD